VIQGAQYKLLTTSDQEVRQSVYLDTRWLQTTDNRDQEV